MPSRKNSLRTDYEKCILLEKELEDRCAVQAKAIEWREKLDFFPPELDSLCMEETALEQEDAAFGQNREILRLATRGPRLLPPLTKPWGIRAQRVKNYNMYFDQKTRFRSLRAKMPGRIKSPQEDSPRQEKCRETAKWRPEKMGGSQERSTAKLRDRILHWPRKKRKIQLEKKNEKQAIICPNFRWPAKFIWKLEELSAWLGQHARDENLSSQLVILEQKAANLEKKSAKTHWQKKSCRRCNQNAKTQRGKILRVFAWKLKNCEKNEAERQGWIAGRQENLAGNALSGKSIEELRAHKDSLLLEKTNLFCWATKV